MTKKRSCRKCGNHVPLWITLNGKKRNLRNRKFCLECSPFGQHNTAQLDKTTNNLDRPCTDCGKQHNGQGLRCGACYFQQRQARVNAKIDSIVGKACWICDYDRTRLNLCFHHVDPTTKTMWLTSRETMLKWERVFAEIKKCIRICHNCHGEIHDGLIPEQEVEQIWRERWNQ